MYLAHYCRRALRHAAYLTIGAWLGGCLSMAQAAEITPIKGTYSPQDRHPGTRSLQWARPNPAADEQQRLGRSPARQ